MSKNEKRDTTNYSCTVTVIPPSTVCGRKHCTTTKTDYDRDKRYKTIQQPVCI
jgi:V8-like Glu-specific endopeptidase